MPSRSYLPFAIVIFLAVISFACEGDSSVTGEADIADSVTRSSAILSSAPLWSVESNQDSAVMGESIAVCDVNHDGYMDIMVGVRGWTNGQEDEGAVFAYFGSASGLPTSPSWSYESNLANSSFYRVACAGDVNGDGYEDVIIGQGLYTNGQTNEGRVCLFGGYSGGLSMFPEWAFESNYANAFLGTSLESAGDVNNDGYADIAVGAYNYSHDQSQEGAAYVFYGSASGLQSTGYWFQESNSTRAYFGSSLGHFDLNSDGYSDVYIGANGMSNGDSNEGRGNIYLGTPGGLSATPSWTWEPDMIDERFGGAFTSGDFNDDGFDDVAIGASGPVISGYTTGRVYIFHGSDAPPYLSASPTAIIESPEAGIGFGSPFAMDYDGDGYADLFAGAARYNLLFGGVFLYRGSSSGLSTTPFWAMTGDQADSHFGAPIRAYPDFNADSYPEILVGQSGYSNGESHEGRVAMYSAYPINDICAYAQDIPSLPAVITGSNIAAQDDYSPSCVGPGGKDVVFKFNGALSDQYIVDLTGNFNTVLAVNFGSCTGTAIGCNDDYNGSFTHSRIEFTAPATGAYYVWVDAWASTEAGTYTLSVTNATAPTTTTTTTTTTSTTSTTGGGDDDSTGDDSLADDASDDDTGICYSCQNTSECINALDSGWVCQDECCVQIDTDDAQGDDNDDLNDDDESGGDNGTGGGCCG